MPVEQSPASAQSAQSRVMQTQPTAESATSTMAWSSWRQRDRTWLAQGRQEEVPGTAANVTMEGRLATAAIYAGAAMNANAVGWGATARAAEAAARQKYVTQSKNSKDSPSPDPVSSASPGWQWSYWSWNVPLYFQPMLAMFHFLACLGSMQPLSLPWSMALRSDLSGSV